MKTQTPIKKKRYEVQHYSTLNMCWYPVYHTDDPKVALRRVNYGVKKGHHTRVRDRVGYAILEAKSPKHE